jgi:ornithine cyclodeaminase
VIPIVEEAALRAAITPERAVAAMRDAFKADGEGRTHVPAVINLDIPAARGEFHVKTAYIEGLPHIAVKVASGFYDNPAKGLPSGSGLMAVFDAATGLPTALLLDNGYLNLARQSIAAVGVIGSGLQARHQVRCLRVVRSFSRVIVWSPNRERLDAYCSDMRSEGFDVVAADGAEAVCAAADVLVTATPARQPVVRGDWLRDGIHVTAVGSDSPGKRELEPSCLDRADLLVVDRYGQCAAFGELKGALDAALITRHDVHGELGQIVAGQRSGRSSDAQITIADLTGVGFQDTAIASAALAALLSDGEGAPPA